MSRILYELDMAITEFSKAPQRVQTVVVVLVCAVLILLTMHSHGEME